MTDPLAYPMPPVAPSPAVSPTGPAPQAPTSETTPPASPPVPPAPPAPKPAASTLKAGSLVAHRYFDPYSDAGPGGAEISLYGMVVDVAAIAPDADGVTRPGARVAWFAAVSDPVPVDELTELA